MAIKINGVTVISDSQAITTTSTISATGNITGGNVSVVGTIVAAGVNTGSSPISTTGNVTGGNVLTGGLISATGNITGSYIFGNGSQLSGIDATQIISGTSNAKVVTSGGNISVSIAGTSNVTVFSPLGQDTAGYISATGNVIGANIFTSGNVSATGDLIGTKALIGVDSTTLTNPVAVFTGSGVAYDQVAIVNTLGTGSADLAVYGNNGDDNQSWVDVGFTGNTFNDVNYTISNAGDGYIFAQGNTSTGGNLIVATGNTGTTRDVVFSFGFLAANEFLRLQRSTNTILPFANTTANLGSSSKYFNNLYVANHIGTTVSATGVVSAGGNVTGANILTGGLLSATGTITGANITGANILTGGIVSSTGNVTGGNLNTGGNVTGSWMLPTSGMSTGGNVLVGGYLSVVGNLYVANIVSSQTLTVDDPLLYLIANVTFPYNYDIGFYSAFTGGPGNTYQHTGVVRDYTDNTWKIVSNVPEPTGSAFDFDNATYDKIKTGNIAVVGNGTFTTTVSAAGTITGGNIATAGAITGASASVSGTVTAASTVGGVITGSSASVTGIVTGASHVGSVVSVTGAITGASVVGGVMTGTSVSVTGGVTSASVAGGVMVGSSVSVSGGVTAASVAGGVITGSSASVTGTVTGASVAGTITTASQTNITAVGTLTSMTTSGTATVNSANNATAVANGGTNGSGNIGASGATFNTVFAKATTAQYADLAEKYVADAEYAPGTVLVFGGTAEVTVNAVDADRKVAGVVSTDPGFVMNDGLVTEFTATVALTGRVPTFVIGPVKKGDLMVAAGLGRARAEADPKVGSVIGKALEDFDGAEGTIEVVIGRF